MTNKNNISINYNSVNLMFNTMYHSNLQDCKNILEKAVNEGVQLIKKYKIKDNSKTDFLIYEADTNIIRRLIHLGLNPVSVYKEIIEKLPYCDEVSQ